MFESLAGWVIVYYAFLWGVVVPFDLILRKKTPISLLGALAIRPVSGAGVVVFWLSLIGSAIVWVYPIVCVLQTGLVEAGLFQSNSFQIVGTLLICFSITLVTIAMVQIGRTYLPNQAELHLMTGGAYGLCRNPVYVGLAAGFLGVFLLLPSNVFLASWTLYLVCNHVRVRREESYLRMKLVREYEAYCRSVGRYGPRLKSLIRRHAARA